MKEGPFTVRHARPPHRKRPRSLKAAALAAVTVLVLLTATREAYGYVGPGAGFAFLSSFLIFFAAFALAGLIFLTTPIRLLVRIVRRRRRLRGRFSRVVVVGLDGMSPVVARRMIDAGELPNFAELERSGSFHALESTLPAVSVSSILPSSRPLIFDVGLSLAVPCGSKSSWRRIPLTDREIPYLSGSVRSTSAKPAR